jgi:hypothetical protein
MAIRGNLIVGSGMEIIGGNTVVSGSLTHEWSLRLLTRHQSIGTTCT